MEEEKNKKRWSVTYTKHVKQKRKVYQDGFLELRAYSDSTFKVKLFDDCAKLLECRILKNEEAVNSGETLTFSSYLVDVGDPDGDHQPLVSDPSFRARARKIVETPPRQKFRSPSFPSFEGRKDEPGKKMARAAQSLSPSRKMIREFKKKEMQRYGGPQSHLDTPEPSARVVWQVLYTTQVTQKAKKYRDGFLQINISGSLGRQVMLSDEGRKVLASRFLKRDEMIQSGESISFDGYLVEIGELEEDHKQSANLNFQQNHSNVGKTKALFGQCKGDVTINNEWQVLYTTHMTQKAKKYHDGFLSLSNIGSLGRQIMLYDSSRKLLETKFLRKDETVEFGKSMAFDTHLVEIGELEEEKQAVRDFNIQRDNFNVSCKARILFEDQNNLRNNRPVMEGMCQSYNSLTEDTDSSSMSSADRTKLCQTVPTNKHLRDARQILAILRKAKAPDYVVSGCDDMTAHSSSVKGLPVSDADLDVSEGSQLLGELFPNQGPAEDGDITGFNETGSKVVSAFMCSQLQKDSESGNSDQSQLNNMEATTKQFSSAMSSSVGAHGLYSPNDNKWENSQQLNHGEEMDECPTFDLGF